MAYHILYGEHYHVCYGMAISKFHGEENYEEPYHYSWLPYTDSTKIGKNYPIIHLRRVRSEEGGTVIIVN